MTNQANKALIQAYFSALAKDKSPTVVDQFVTDEALKHHITFFEVAFPRYQLIADDLIAEGDKVVARCRMQGVHQGDLMGIPPTGKAAIVDLILIYRIKNNKIAEHWMVADQLGLLQQLGVLPNPNSRPDEA